MSGYDYGNARLRAMKSRLLSRDELETLAEAGSIQELTTALTSTVYRHHMEAAMVRGQAAITYGLRAHLIDHFTTVRSVYQGRERALVSALLLPYDVHNVKTILRGLAHRVPAQELAETLLPIGDLSDPVLTEMRRLSDVRAAIDVLASIRSPLAHPLLELRAEHPGAELQEMELVLDRWYFKEVRRRLNGNVPKRMSQSLDMKADITNLLTIFRLVHSPSTLEQVAEHRAIDEAESLLVGPGRLSFHRLIQAGNEDSLEGAVSALRDTTYREVLQEGLEDFQNSRRLSAFEVVLRRFHLHWQARQIARDPLGIGVPLGYIALKINEARNIRWIAQGIDLGLSAEVIKEGLEII